MLSASATSRLAQPLYALPAWYILRRRLRIASSPGNSACTSSSASLAASGRLCLLAGFRQLEHDRHAVPPRSRAARGRDTPPRPWPSPGAAPRGCRARAGPPCRRGGSATQPLTSCNGSVHLTQVVEHASELERRRAALGLRAPGSRSSRSSFVAEHLRQIRRARSGESSAARVKSCDRRVERRARRSARVRSRSVAAQVKQVAQRRVLARVELDGAREVRERAARLVRRQPVLGDLGEQLRIGRRRIGGELQRLRGAPRVAELRLVDQRGLLDLLLLLRSRRRGAAAWSHSARASLSQAACWRYHWTRSACSASLVGFLLEAALERALDAREVVLRLGAGPRARACASPPRWACRARSARRALGCDPRRGARSHTARARLRAARGCRCRARARCDTHRAPLRGSSPPRSCRAAGCRW